MSTAPPATNAVATPAASTPAATSATPTRLRRIADLPGPRSWPLLGSSFQVRVPTIHQDMEAWARRYGPLFHVKLGPNRLLVVSDHALVLGVLRDRPDGFSRSPRVREVTAEMGGNPGLFTAEGPAWQAQRRMVMSSFAPDRIRAYVPTLLRVTQRLQARWQRAASSGAVIDLQADLKLFTVDAIAGLAFGTDVNSIEGGENPIHHHLDTIFAATFRRIMSPVPYWRWITTPADRQLAISLTAVQGAVAGFVTQAKARLQADPALRAAPANLLEAMLVAAAQDGSEVSEKDVAGNVSTMLLAGEDTTANSLAWLIDLLARNPPALARAVAEVRCLPTPLADLTVDQLDRLPWLDACITEAMRLKPVAPFLGLQALRDTVVGDVAVPADTLLWCVMRHHSVDDGHFADAAAFHPQRWLAGDGQAASAQHPVADKRVSMPFGAGPRMCPGRYLALLEMKLLMVMLLGSFEIDSVRPRSGAAGSATGEVMSFTMNPVALQMRLRPASALKPAPAAV